MASNASVPYECLTVDVANPANKPDPIDRYST